MERNGREESKKGAGVDMKWEVLLSAISEHVSGLGERSTEQWSRSSRVRVELKVSL